jgi:Ca-activated chloride channel family protein
MWIILVSAVFAGVPTEDVRWDIAVRGPVAEAIVTQRFEGPRSAGQRGEYVFALPHQGVVDDMTMVIGDTVIQSVLRESRHARQEYEVAARDGQIAGLTTQVAGGVFRQELSNIPVGQDIEVQLRVLWPVTRVDGQYELVIPTDVAPRFGGFDDHPSLAPESTTYPLHIGVDVQAGFNMTAVHSPTHEQADITVRGSHAGLSWQGTGSYGDMVLRWQNSTGATQAAAITNGDHSLLVMEGPAPTSTDAGAIEWVIILDTSGSMSGTPWRRAMGLIDKLLAQVGPEDTVGLLTFGQSIQHVAPVGGEEGIRRVRFHLGPMGPNGGTLLPRALSAAVALPHDGAMRRVMVLITDGLVTDEDGSLTALASAGLRADLSIVGVNASPNRVLLNRLAVAANGTSAYYLPGDTASSVAHRVLTSLTHAKCMDVRVEWSTGVQAWPNEPGPLLPGRPMVIAAQHRETPAWVDVSCHLNGERWSRHIVPTHVDRGRGLQAAWARQNLEALLHDGWATNTDPQLKATAIALEYRILSPWTSLVAVESRPNGDGSDWDAVAMLDEREEGLNKPATAGADGSRHIEYQNPAAHTTRASQGQVLTRDFFNQIPSGRGYQSAVGMAAGVRGGGGNPNISGGTSNENTYILDGINITDPISKTVIQCFDEWAPSPSDASIRISPPVLPDGPSGTNAVVADVGGAGGTANQHEAHGIVGGPLIKDHLWILAQTHYRNWDTAQAQQSILRLTLEQSQNHTITVDADIHRIETPTIRLDRRDIHAVSQWFPVQGMQVFTRAEASTLRLGSRVRRAAFATSELHIARRTWEVGGHSQLGQIALKGGTRTWIARAESFGRYKIIDLWVIDGAAGIVHSGSLAPTGRFALRGSTRGGDLLGSIAAEQISPDLTENPGDTSTLPIQRRIYGSIELALHPEIWLGAHGQLDDTTTWMTGSDSVAVTGSGELVHSQGPSGTLWLEKLNGKRWDAKLTWTVSARIAADGELESANVADAQEFTDSLRPHRVFGTFGWALPYAAQTTTLRFNGEWASAIDGSEERWAAPRLSLGMAVEQNVDIRNGTLVIQARVRRGVATGVGALTTHLGPTLQWSRLSERLQDGTHVQLGLTWRT